MSEPAAAPSIAVTTIALRFVADLQAGKRPSIEAALDSAPRTEWPTLLNSLLIAEVNSRRARGERPLPREYLPRFPAHIEIVRSVLPDVPRDQTAHAHLAPIVEPMETPPTALPVARVAVPIAVAAAPIPRAITLPRSFADFEEQPVPAQPRRRGRVWLFAAGTLVLLLVGGGIVLKLTSKRHGERPRPAGTDPHELASANTKTKPTLKIDPKSPPLAGERGLAEWVQRLGGSGTLAMDAGGKRPLGPEMPLPKNGFSVIALSLPADFPPRWNASDLAALRGHEKLASVQLHHPTDLTDASLEPLVGAPLRRLDLRGANVQVSGATLAKFPKLVSLTLLSDPSFSDADMKEVGHLKELASLAVDSPKLTAEGFKELKALPLRSLLFGPRVKLTADGMREFQGLPLEEFEADGALTDDAFLELAVVATLKKIYLHNAKITDSGLKTVAGLGKLEALKIQGGSFTAAGIEHLSELNKLKVLDLSHSRLGNAGLEKLLVLQGLKELDLAGCPINDEGVNYLAQFDGLEILDLGETLVTDKGLSILKKHATLKSLILTGTKVSAAGVADFESGTPQCKVVTGRRK